MSIHHRTTQRTNLRCQDRDFWSLSKGIFSVALVTKHSFPSIKANPQTIGSNVSCRDGKEK